MSELHSHCTLWKKSDNKKKFRIKRTGVVRFIELYWLSIKIIFSLHFTAG
jgi:hypothetical protein